MQIDWIVSLVAVVEHGGFSAAGEETHRSQSRISAHIASLERTLGAVLIDRRTRPVSLTDTGRAYFPHARSALDELRRGADDVAALTNQVSGTVVVGSSFSISAGYLAKVIAELRASHPAIVVEVVEGLAAPTIEELAAGNVDLAVLPGGFSEHEVNLRHQTLWDEPYVAVINQLHQLAGEGPIDPAELRGHPLLVIGRAGGEPDLEITTLLDSWDLRHQVHNPTESPQTLANLVKHGVGVGVINALAMQVSDTDGLSVRPFAGEQLRRTVAMWWDPQPYLNVAVRTVMDAIRDGAAPDLSDYGS